jgi:dihydroxy-acid dehydratase
MTVTGRTLGENLEQWTAKYGELSDTQDVIRPLDKPLKQTGHIRCVVFAIYESESREAINASTSMIRILRGNLAPGGAVSKITGKEGLTFTGKARTFDSEDDMVRAVENGELKKGEKTVVVLRYLGPKGGPGAST